MTAKVSVEQRGAPGQGTPLCSADTIMREASDASYGSRNRPSSARYRSRSILLTRPPKTIAGCSG